MRIRIIIILSINLQKLSAQCTYAHPGFVKTSIITIMHDCLHNAHNIREMLTQKFLSAKFVVIFP